MGETLEGSLISVQDLNFYVSDSGQGPAVVLLHGFPDTSSLWRHQVPYLVESGFRVIAPDLRGRGKSAMPQEIEAYSLPLIVQDITSLMSVLDISTASIVGHDWGAVVAWLVASFAPERVDKLIALSVGHPASFSPPTLAQMEKSWYMWVFQHEGVAEDLFSKDDWRLFRQWSRSSPDSESYIEDLSRPGAFTAGLNWYRANRTVQTLVADPLPFPRIKCPTLGIWSKRDFALSEEMMVRSSEFVDGDWRYERFEDSGHWIPLEEPEKLNELLSRFIR